MGDVVFREWPKTPREQTIERAYLEMLAKITMAHDEEVRRLESRIAELSSTTTRSK